MLPLEARHVEEVTALEREAFAGADPWTADAFRREIASHCSLWRIAMDEGKVAGYGGGWIIQDEFHILNLAVPLAARRRGTGRRLLREILACAAERGCTSATLEVRRANAAARQLYESEGFRPTGARPGYYSNGEDAMIYWLVGLAAV
jgi:ribosomal-protein-alanine acetyltransferase